MGVSTFTQPDYTSDTATQYKTNLDDAAAVFARIADAFAPHEQSTPDMTVRVDAGFIPARGGTATEVNAQNTGSLSAPSGNPRYDIVYIDAADGTVGVATGAEAGSPSDPAVPAGKVAVARIHWTVGMSEITNADLDDLRNPGLLGLAGVVQDDVITTRGDIVRGDSSGDAERLALGTSGQVLTSDGTDADWATPLFSESYDSGNQTITSGGSLTLAHSLSAQPKLIMTFLVCNSAEGNYSAGDWVRVEDASDNDSSGRGVMVLPDATNVNIRFSATAAAFSLINKTSGVNFLATNSNWRFRVLAWA